MDLSLNETQKMVQQTARDFATRVIAPQAAEIDEKERFPREILKGLAELGLMAVNVPDDVGGSAAGAVSYALAMQEVAKACASTAVAMAVTNMVGEVIAKFGTPEQRSKYCPRLASGEYVAGAFALSEPGAGSDPGGMSTTATKDGDSWVIDGAKQWITTGAHAGVFVVWARTGARDTHRGHAASRASSSKAERPASSSVAPKTRWASAGSNTVALQFEGCRVPASALLGDLNGGFRIAMMALDGGRIGISAQAIGIARAALEESVQYAKDRRAFDKPIAEFQAIQWKLADMATELDAAHLLCMRAAWLKENGRVFSREASMAKVMASESAVRICNEAVQIHGGYGYIREFAAERHLRDVRVTMIYEGTSEVQRIVIARSLIGP